MVLSQTAARPTQKPENSISSLIRRKVTQVLTQVCWYGDLEEIEFLSRLYDLQQLPSTDDRYEDAERDIFQHRINNEDWDDFWSFADDRFGLRNGSDEISCRLSLAPCFVMAAEVSHSGCQVRQTSNQYFTSGRPSMN